MTGDTPTPQNAQESVPAKQGAAIGGWVCFALGTLIMYLSVWTFILYVPLFFVAFVLSIVAMAQRRIVLGIVLLLATILFPLIEWLALATTRTNKFLDEQGVPKVNAFHRPETPAPTRTDRALSTPVVTPRANAQKDVSTQIPIQEAKEDVSAAIWSGLHAWQIRLGATTLLQANSLGLAPAFSADGKSVMIVNVTGNAVSINIYRLADHQLLRSWVPAAIPTSLGWSSERNKLAYRSGSDLHVVDLTTLKDIALPEIQRFGHDTAPILWLSDDKLISPASDPVSELDLEALSVRYLNLSTDPKLRSDQIARLLPKSLEHPHCRIYQDNDNHSVGYENIFVSERDDSYCHALFRRGSGQRFYVSPDLRHILIYEDNSCVDYALISRTAPPMVFHVEGVSVKVFQEGYGHTVTEFIKRRVPFFGDIFTPLTNPLNGKQVGPDGKHFKAQVRIIAWSDNEVVVRPVMEFEPVGDGDIVANIASAQVYEWSNSQSAAPGVWGVLHSVSKVPDSKERDQSHAEPVKEHPNSEAAASYPGEHFPETRTRILAAEDLQNWKEDKLRYAINELFARRGATFGDKALSTLFSQFSWYHPDPTLTLDQVESLFSDIEKQNLKLLGEYRDAKRASSGQQSQR